MTITTEERPVFENEEWLVTEGGLEHKGTGYFIGRETVGRRRSDGLWAWPLHMAEKQWCSLAPFTEAFTCAAALYDIKADTDLAHSLRAARCDVAAWPPTPQQPHQAIATFAESLNRGDQITISLEAPRVQDFWARDSRNEGPQTGHQASQAFRERSLGRGRARAGSVHGAASLRWRTPRPIRRAGTRLVELLQAALSRK